MLEVKIKKSLSGFDLDICFNVDREILAILGPSGSGKTMTLQCIAGLVKPDSGYIKLNDQLLFDSDKKICHKPQTRRVGFVFQNYALFPHLTVRDNIGYGIKNLSKAEMADKTGSLLEKMHIANLGHRYPKQLSAGQQQRVALARALAPEPEVLLLDEPFSALDTQVKERMELELATLQNIYNGIILFVTHNLAEGYKMASRIAVYESGRIVQCDEKNRVIESPANRTVARLTGVRNLMRGTVTEVDEASVRTFVPELNGHLDIQCNNGSCFSKGQAVTVGIRPENIHLVDREQANAFLCNMERIVEGVSLINCFFATKEIDAHKHWLEVSLHKSHAPQIQEGHSSYIYLPPGNITLIKG